MLLYFVLCLLTASTVYYLIFIREIGNFYTREEDSSIHGAIFVGSMIIAPLFWICLIAWLSGLVLKRLSEL